MSMKPNIISCSDTVKRGVQVIGTVLAGITDDPLERLMALAMTMEYQVDATGIRYDIVEKGEDELFDEIRSLMDIVAGSCGDDEDDICD